MLHIVQSAFARVRGMLITAAAPKYAVGMRVVYNLDDDEWFVGTVVKVDASRVYINYDDGHVAKKGSPLNDKHIYFYTGTTKQKKPLTDAQAKKVISKTPPVDKKAAKPSAKVPVKKAEPKAPTKPTTKETYPWEGKMVEIKYNSGPVWRMCYKLTPGAVHVVERGDPGGKLRPINRRFALRWREPTAEEKKEYEARNSRVAEHAVRARANGMVEVNFRDRNSWKFCYSVDTRKGSFAIAGSGGKFRHIPLTLALQNREATEREKEDAAEMLAWMNNRRGQYNTRESRLSYLRDWFQHNPDSLRWK